MNYCYSKLKKNFEQYFSKFFHFYFDRSDDKKIKITEVLCFNNDGHIDLLLCRFDRTGRRSVARKNNTRTEDWSVAWLDEKPHKPMTRDEIREAFQELAGVFQDQQDLQKLKSKIAV